MEDCFHEFPGRLIHFEEDAEDLRAIRHIYREPPMFRCDTPALLVELGQRRSLANSRLVSTPPSEKWNPETQAQNPPSDTRGPTSRQDQLDATGENRHAIVGRPARRQQHPWLPPLSPSQRHLPLLRSAPLVSARTPRGAGTTGVNRHWCHGRIRHGRRHRRAIVWGFRCCDGRWRHQFANRQWRWRHHRPLLALPGELHEQRQAPELQRPRGRPH